MPARVAKSQLSHLNAAGEARMVDVSSKEPLVRTAVAAGCITLRPATLKLIRSGETPKGDVLAVARIAGIQAAKETSRLIPLCHPLPLSAVDVAFDFTRSGIAIRATVRTTARTGVEMEALTAVSVAALTLYDMCKAVDTQMVIGPIQLESKTKTPPPQRN
jgi:cyclic pyranopterin phosphate synthase